MKTLNRALLIRVFLLVLGVILLSGCSAGIGPGGAGASIGQSTLSSIQL
jgi:hypothetical protein